jgi:RecB family exonuclease
MVVVGLNHPFVPESVTADPFLPGALRTRLKVADNERRLARDAYALQLILATRPATRLIVGRRGVDGSPPPPSRLLAACDPPSAARRVLQLLDAPTPSVPVVHRWSGVRETTDLPIPGPQEGRPIKTLSVTAFRDYLACPYRFYLRHVLRLRPLDDASQELAANQFGDLVHGAVERFGESADKDTEEAEEIFALLVEHLQAFARHRYGEDPAPAVRLQIAQAERRLRIVADRQAERRRQGWQIWAAEAGVDEKKGAGIEVDGDWMGLRGRFDRIDFHPQTGQWAILDYKTHGHPPLKKHLEKSTGRWLDLQLPLYRLMAPFLQIEAPPEAVELGYFNIADKADETGVNLARFTEEQYQEATEVIHDCVRGIWAGRFEISSDPVPFDDYAMICQTGIAQHLLDGVDPEVGEDSE